MRLFSVIRKSAAEVNPEIGYLQGKKQNIVQVGADNGRFCENWSFRNLRKLAGTLCEQNPNQDDCSN
jgi:hypothetical protein